MLDGSVATSKHRVEWPAGRIDCNKARNNPSNWFSARIALMPLNWNGAKVQQSLTSILWLCLQLVWIFDLCCSSCFSPFHHGSVHRELMRSGKSSGLRISSGSMSPSAWNIECLGAWPNHLGPRNERCRGGLNFLRLYWYTDIKRPCLASRNSKNFS